MLHVLVFQAGDTPQATFEAGLAAHDRLRTSSLAGGWVVMANRGGGDVERWAPDFTNIDVNGLHPAPGYFLVVLADPPDEPAAVGAVKAVLAQQEPTPMFVDPLVHDDE